LLICLLKKVAKIGAKKWKTFINIFAEKSGKNWRQKMKDFINIFAAKSGKNLANNEVPNVFSLTTTFQSILF
jgi:hypothetical protein